MTKKVEKFQDPEIATAQIFEGILTYRTMDPKDTFKLKRI